MTELDPCRNRLKEIQMTARPTDRPCENCETEVATYGPYCSPDCRREFEDSDADTGIPLGAMSDYAIARRARHHGTARTPDLLERRRMAEQNNC